MGSSKHGQTAATLMGIAAVVMWGTLFAIVRSVIEQMGMLWSMSAANLIAGAVGLAIAAGRPGGWAAIRKLPKTYLAGCGFLFVVYNAALYLALAMASDRAQVVEVTLVNYLWPALTVALMVPILGKRARVTLLPGLAMALLGIYLGMRTGSQVSLAAMGDHVLANPPPYLLGLVAALSWALYSNLARRWAGGSNAGAVPVFLTATGVALGAAALAFEPLPAGGLRVRGAIELLYLALFPTMLAYLFWDAGVRKGNIAVISSASFFAPLISTLINCAYLQVPMGRDLWAACGLVIAGAAVCRGSLVDESYK